jgi:2'-5' RNA ligase
MRLFVAIDLSDAARRAIAVEQERLAEVLGPSSSLKWVRPDHMHLTLAFLGEIEETRAAAVIDVMGKNIDEAQPFAIAIAGLGVFPPHGAPRVLWVGLSTGAREAIELQRHVVDRLSRIGVTLEERAFHPHLTLARWRQARPADRGRVAAAERGLEVARVEVDAVTLYQSRLSSAGLTHTVGARAPLVRSVRLEPNRRS